MLQVKLPILHILKNQRVLRRFTSRFSVSVMWHIVQIFRFELKEFHDLIWSANGSVLQLKRICWLLWKMRTEWIIDDLSWQLGYVLQSTLAAARADNFYYPPEWTPEQVSRSLHTIERCCNIGIGLLDHRNHHQWMKGWWDWFVILLCMLWNWVVMKICSCGLLKGVTMLWHWTCCANYLGRSQQVSWPTCFAGASQEDRPGHPGYPVAFKDLSFQIDMLPQYTIFEHFAFWVQ
jgi:hypothetical protein